MKHFNSVWVNGLSINLLKRSINFLQKTWVLSREEGSALKLLPQRGKLFATLPLLHSCSPPPSPKLGTDQSGCTLVALSPLLLLFPHHLSLLEGDEAGQTFWEGACLLGNQTHHPPGKESSRGGNFVENEKFMDNHKRGWRGQNPHLHLPTFCISFWRQKGKNFTFFPAPGPAPGWSHGAKLGLATMLPPHAPAADKAHSPAKSYSPNSLKTHLFLFLLLSFPKDTTAKHLYIVEILLFLNGLAHFSSFTKSSWFPFFFPSLNQ